MQIRYIQESRQLQYIWEHIPLLVPDDSGAWRPSSLTCKRDRVTDRGRVLSLVLIHYPCLSLYNRMTLRLICENCTPYCYYYYYYVIVIGTEIFILVSDSE